MKTAMQELIEIINDNLKNEYTSKEFARLTIFKASAEKLLEKEKEQSIELIKQTAMFMAASNLDEDIAKMSYEDVYNTYYNQNK